MSPLYLALKKLSNPEVKSLSISPCPLTPAWAQPPACCSMLPYQQTPATNISLQTSYCQHTTNINSTPDLTPTDTGLATNIHSLQDPPPTDSSLQTAFSQDLLICKIPHLAIPACKLPTAKILPTSIACKITHPQIPACKLPTHKIVLTSTASKILHLKIVVCHIPPR